VLALVVVVSMPGAAGAQVPAGGEFLVNSYTTGPQWFPVVAMERDADLTIAWVGVDGGMQGILGQRFDADGTPRGGEFQVNTYTTGPQGNLGGADLSVGDGGEFVLVWPSLEQDGDLYGVFAQRFDSTGAPAGAEFQVNTYTTLSQGDGFAGSIGVAKAPGGSFVVVWDSQGQDGSATGIFMRRFDAAGDPLGGEVAVNTYTTGDQLRPDIAMDGGGNFVVVWGGLGRCGLGWRELGWRELGRSQVGCGRAEILLKFWSGWSRRVCF
jgi:hypothetical protein